MVDPAVTIIYKDGWDPGQVWTNAKNFAPTGIRSRIIQPAANRYTDYATPVNIIIIIIIIYYYYYCHHHHHHVIIIQTAKLKICQSSN